MPSLNVTEAHLCHRCPRLLGYLAAGRRAAWKVGLKGRKTFPGKLFHDLVARPFQEQMCRGGRGGIHGAVSALLRKGAGGNLEKDLLAAMDRHLFEPMLMERGATLRADQIADLAGAMACWSRHLAAFFAHCREGGRRIRPSDLFAPPEEKRSALIQIAGGDPVRLTGRCDSVLIHPGTREAVIVEFKGTRPHRTDEDLIQVGLYALLLRRGAGRGRKAIQWIRRIRGMVLYLESREQAAEYDPDTLSGLRDNLVRLVAGAASVKARARQKGQVHLDPPPDPGLCGVCPYDSTCDRDWGPRTIHADQTPGEDESGEAEGMLGRLIDTLAAVKLPVAPAGYVLGPRLMRLKIRPVLEKGATVARIERRAGDLQVALGTRVPPLIQTAAGHMTVDIPRKVTTPLTLGEVWERGGANRPDSRAAFPLGMAVDGAIFWVRLDDPAMTSILVAGTAGSGKSVLLRAAILGMARNAGADRLRFTLIDPKLVSFTDFAALPHLAGAVICEAGRALNALKRLVRAMDRRYERFARAGAFDIGGYRRDGGAMPHHVVVIDEYADLMIDRDSKNDTEQLIQRLCQKGRAAGFHVILSTQRPDARVVTPLIKANLQLKIALKVTTRSNSTVILDARGAENLMGNGDMLVGGAVPLTRLQGPLPTRTDLQRVLDGGYQERVEVGM